MKKLVAVLSIGLIVCGILSAQEEKKEKNNFQPDITLQSHWLTAYVGPSGVYYHKGQVIQSELNLEWKCGLYLGVWWSQDATGNMKSLGNEIDYTVGYSKELAWGINLEGCVSYCDIAKFGEIDGDMLWYRLEIKRPFTFTTGVLEHEIAPYGRVEYYQPLSRDQPKGEFLGEVGVSYGVTYSRIIFKTLVGGVHDNGLFGGSRGQLVVCKVGVSFKVNDYLSMDGSYTLYAPISHFEDGRFNNGVVGIWSVGATIQF